MSSAGDIELNGVTLPLLPPPDVGGGGNPKKGTEDIQIPIIEPPPSEGNKLFQAVKDGSLIILKDLLESQKCDSAVEQDEDGKTILHHAVKYPRRTIARGMTEAILENWEKTSQKGINLQDNKKQTAAHIAAEHAMEKILLLLDRHNADLMISDEKGTPLDLIYVNLPHLVIVGFNKGVKYDSSHEKVELNFNKLTMKDEEIESKTFEPLLKVEPETVKEVLDHCLVQAFIYMKYQRAYPFILASIISHIFWHAIYAYFIFNVYYTNCPWKHSAEIENLTIYGNETLALASVACDAVNFQSYEVGLAVTCWILGFIFLAKELFEIFTVPSCPRYFLELENIGQLLVIASVFWTSWPVYEYLAGNEQITINPWQYKVASISVFIVWSLVLGQVCKIQQLRIYIEIFIKVFKSFLLFICTFASLLFAFAFSFCILMPEGKAFKSPWLAVPKVLVMMTGELNYDEVFHAEDTTSGLPYHYLTTQILFSLFTILMSMILLNLLIGLAVTDTQELRANCHLAELSSMLEEVFLLEAFASRVSKVTSFRWPLARLSVLLVNDGKEAPGFSLSKWFRVGADPKHTKMTEDGLVYGFSFAKSEKFPFPSQLMEPLRDLADLNSHNS